MRRKVFLFLIALMSISLLGIIFVQTFWIKKAFEQNARQFTMSAKQALIKVANQVEQHEIDRYYVEFIKLSDTAKPSSRTLSRLFQIRQNKLTNQTFFYSNSILQENYKLSTPILGNSGDSINFKRLTNRKVTRIVRQDIGSNRGEFTAQEKFKRISQLPKMEKKLFLDAIQAKAAKLPIRRRVNEGLLKSLINAQLELRNINSPYEFAIYDGDMATPIHSDGFSKKEENIYGINLFGSAQNNYQLYIGFTEQKREVLSSMNWLLGLSILFTVIIIFAYGSAIYLLQKQRKIAIIKNDFINNMTHEFKTPIATINLALDALQNKKMQQDEGRLNTYLKMMDDENNRMHAQVESILRISRLERNELNVSKERVNLHELIEDAIARVRLRVEERNGHIHTDLEASNTFILASQSHFTNVIVNILDNSVKYSENEPKIDIFTENVKDFIVLRISDEGKGMNKTIQKKIFDKFYREHTGNIHNVKGHGLGLAYVKQMVADHHGQIYVESEKGKGSTFIIKLPVIT